MCVSLFTHLFTLFHSPVGIFPPTSPHSYPPITSFSTSSGFISSYLSSLLPTYSLFFTFQSVLSKIFPPTTPHSYPPIHSFSTSSGFISACLSSFLPTYSLFLYFQWVNFCKTLLILTHLSHLSHSSVGILQNLSKKLSENFLNPTLYSATTLHSTTSAVL